MLETLVFVRKEVVWGVNSESGCLGPKICELLTVIEAVATCWPDVIEMTLPGYHFEQQEEVQA